MEPFLIKSEEGEDNCVRFTVSLSCVGEKNPDIDDIEIEALKDILSKAALLCPDKNNTYEIRFERYLMYQVRNESYCSWDHYEIRKGSSFIIFEKSRLLDMLPVITDCQILADTLPGEWKHYGIYCLNHIIDVISCNEPIITRISSI